MHSFKNGLLLPAGLLLLWYVISALHVFSPYLLPSPGATLAGFQELCASGALLHHLTISLQRVFCGFFCSCAAAIPLGIFCGRSRNFESYCWPLLEFIRHVPPLACVPLIILWAGIGEASKLVIIFLASFFPLFLNTYSGIKNCDRKLLEVGKDLGFTASSLVWHIQLPAALDAIAVGLQLSLGYSWRALIGAELIAASAGIGYLILDAEEMSRPDIVLVGMLCIGIIGSVIDSLFLHLLDHWLPWRRKAGAPRADA